MSTFEWISVVLWTVELGFIIWISVIDKKMLATQLEDHKLLAAYWKQRNDWKLQKQSKRQKISLVNKVGEPEPPSPQSVQEIENGNVL
jgi:hypothetical protein